MTFRSFVFSSALAVFLIIALVGAQDENVPIEIENNSTGTNFQCTVNGKTYSSDECLESLGKFGKIVTWIIVGVLLIIFACCCGFWCCICKIIHGKKHRSGSQVLRQASDPVITTVA